MPASLTPDSVSQDGAHDDAERDRWNLTAVRDALTERSALAARCAAFARHCGGVARLSPRELAAALSEFAALRDELRCWASYAHLELAGHCGVEERRLAARTDELLTQAGAQLEFFEREWIEIPAEQARAMLAHSALRSEQRYLTRLRQLACTVLDPAEERMLAEREPAAQGAWIDLYELISVGLEVAGPDGPTDIAGAYAQLEHHDATRRAAFADALAEAIEPGREIVAHCLDTLVRDRLDVDRLRGLRYPRHGTDLENDLHRSVVEQMLDTIDRHVHLAHAWWGEKCRLLGTPGLTIADTRASLEDGPDVPYEQAMNSVAGALRELDGQLATIVESLAAGGHLDAQPRPGKGSAAFCLAPSRVIAPYVLVNHRGSLGDLGTLAHELGHATHYAMAATGSSMLAWAPSPLMSEIPAIVTELLTLRHWAEAACDTEVRRAVHAHLGDRLCDLVFRQAAIARFEESAYRARAEGTLLEAETLDELWLDALRPAHEPLVEIPDSYRSAWAYVPHLFSRPFYNHTYCLAALTSLLLLERRDENPAEFEAIYRGLLGTGDSADPASQLRACGVELTSQDTWERALGCFARAVHRGPASRLPGCPGP